MTELQEGKLSNLSVIMLDIDYFKSVNDVYGHERGNAILVKLAQILRRFQINNPYTCEIWWGRVCFYFTE